VGTGFFGDLDPEGAYATAASIDEDSRARLDVRDEGVVCGNGCDRNASRDQRRDTSRDRTGQARRRGDILRQRTTNKRVGVRGTEDELTGFEVRAVGGRHDAAADVEAWRRGLLDCEFADEGRF